MNVETAKEILTIASACSRAADESAAKVKDDCDEKTFKIYARHVGRIMGNIFTEVLSPIYEEHPALAPDWYKAGDRNVKLTSELRVSGSLQAELVRLMDDIYERIEAIARTLRARSDDAEANLYLSRLHEVLLHVAAAKADLLSVRATEDFKENDVGVGEK